MTPALTGRAEGWCSLAEEISVKARGIWTKCTFWGGAELGRFVDREGRFKSFGLRHQGILPKTIACRGGPARVRGNSPRMAGSRAITAPQAPPAERWCGKSPHLTESRDRARRLAVFVSMRPDYRAEHHRSECVCALLLAGCAFAGIVAVVSVAMIALAP